MNQDIFNKKILEILEKVDTGGMAVLLEHAELIHSLADHCRETPLFQKGYSKGAETFKDFTAEEIYNQMLYKIVHSPMQAMASASVILILPFVSDALKVAQAEEKRLSEELKTVSGIMKDLDAEEDRKNADRKQALKEITGGE